MTAVVTAASDGRTLVYGHRTLSLKSYDYYFDLRAGKVGGSETAWSVSTDAGGHGNGAFEVHPLTDAYVVPGKTAPTAGQCAANATRHPAEGLPAPQLTLSRAVRRHLR